MTAPELAVQRLRHPLKFRLLQVRRTERLSPALVRVTLTGDELADFVSASYDDHVKLFFPAPGEALPALPQAGPNGPVFPNDQPRPTARDYTPRRFDAAARELDIDFVLHGDGPACTWAAQAQPGQYLGVGGPRGSFVIPTGYDWYLLVGDETALPAIARRLEELPAGKLAIVVIEASSAAGRIAFHSQAHIDLHWRYRYADGASDEQLAEAVRQLALPPGEGYAWAAGETHAIRAVRQHLVMERGMDKTRIRAAGYWRRGSAAAHESIDD